MFGGDDKFLEASLDAGGFPAKLGTPVGKLAMQGLVVASVAGGWVLTPSVRPVVKGVFAAAAGGLGLVARQRLMRARRSAASPVLAQLLSRKGVTNVGYDEAFELAKAYGVAEADFGAQLAELYSIYLSGCLRSPQAKTAELSDLLTMMRQFKLSFDVVGDATFAAAGRFFSEQRAYFESDEEHEAKQKLDKLVFLADRTLGEDPSEEGFRYEKTRLSKKFGLSEADWQARVERVASPFYRELLTTIVKDPSKVSERDLAAVGAQLGLSEQSMLKMKLEELRRFATQSLETSAFKFTKSQLERLEGIRSSYGLTEDAAREAVEGVVSPAYTQAVGDVVAELAESVTDETAKLLGKLALRQQELSLSTAGATKLEVSATKQRAASMVTSALTSLRSQNTAEAGGTLDRLLTFSDRVLNFVKKSGKASADATDASVLATYFGGVSNLCTSSEANQLYRVFLLRALEQSKLDATAEATLARLKLVLGMSDADASRAFEEAAGPVYKSKLEEVAASGATSFPAERATELQELEKQLGLPADVVTRQKAAVYKARLAEKAGSGKIPSEADDVVLDALRTFLGLSDGVTEPIHVEVCSASYAGSVKEVMGSTGIILDEYWEGLVKLQARLRLPEIVAEEIYLGEARRKLKEIGGKAVEEMLAYLDKEMNKKDGDDSEGNMSMGGVVSAEALKLVEFARAARLVVQADGGEICKTNLRGLIDPKSLKELYRQFLIECFNGQGEDSEKRLGEAGLLARVLGLDNAEVSAIQTDLGAVIYRKYLGKVLTERQLNDEDREFLVSIQNALGMDSEQCERLLTETKKMRVSTMVERMFDSSQVSPEAVAGVRDTAEGFGLDLQRDLQLPVSRLARMLRCEMEAAIEAGDVPPDDTSRLQELQEAYGLPEATVTKELQDCIERRCNGHLLQAMSALRRNQADLVLEETEQLLRFNALSPFKVTSSAVQPNELQEILMRYQSNAMKDGPMDDAAKARIRVLRTALGLEEAAANA